LRAGVSSLLQNEGRGLGVGGCLLIKAHRLCVSLNSSLESKKEEEGLRVIKKKKA